MLQPHPFKSSTHFQKMTASSNNGGLVAVELLRAILHRLSIWKNLVDVLQQPQLKFARPDQKELCGIDVWTSKRSNWNSIRITDRKILVVRTISFRQWSVPHIPFSQEMFVVSNWISLVHNLSSCSIVIVQVLSTLWLCLFATTVSKVEYRWAFIMDVAKSKIILLQHYSQLQIEWSYHQAYSRGIPESSPLWTQKKVSSRWSSKSELRHTPGVCQDMAYFCDCSSQ